MYYSRLYTPLLSEIQNPGFQFREILDPEKSNGDPRM